MKRVARWLFNVLVCMSLLGCVAAAGIWGWSYWRTFESKQFEYRGESCRVFAQGGKVGVDNDPHVQEEIREAARAARRFDQELDELLLEERAIRARAAREEIYVATGLKKHGDYPPFASGINRFHFGRMSLQQIKPVRPWSHASVLIVPGVCGVLAIAPGLAFAGWSRTRRRRRRGLCVTCGYDLRASGERCSECGSSVGANKD